MRVYAIFGSPKLNETNAHTYTYRRDMFSIWKGKKRIEFRQNQICDLNCFHVSAKKFFVSFPQSRGYSRSWILFVIQTTDKEPD